jgi:hypothetical protein
MAKMMDDLKAAERNFEDVGEDVRWVSSKGIVILCALLSFFYSQKPRFDLNIFKTHHQHKPTKRPMIEN